MGRENYLKTKGGIDMLKNFKRASAILLSFAMAIQFGMTDTYYANTVS